MKIETIKVQNYRVFRSLNLTDVPEYAVFVGANGTGKSTFFDIFGFLKDCLSHNVRQALMKRGGFNEVISRDVFDDSIQFELQFRLDIAGVERLVTYLLEIGENKGKPVIEREVLRYKRGRYGSPYHFLDFKKGHGFAITNEEQFNIPDEELEREEQTLDSPDILAVKGLGQFQKFKAASAFRQLIENWYVSDFHINQARGSKEAGYSEHLSEQGENLPLVAQYIYENHREVFDMILEKMKSRVPGIEKVEAKPTEDGRLVLKFQDGSFKDPFIDKFVSDGTIKMFAYLILLHDPHPHPLICVEEPENQLYPHLLNELAEEFREYSIDGGQVFVSTHSPDFLNGVKLSEVFWLKKEAGYTEIERAEKNSVLKGLYEEGDLPGTMWRQKLFTGANI